ncbi:MAG: hypothetical protein LBH22_08945 [Bacteroidales bacterium]|jgi:hypothetical protein|nr:hypothetical protein [Bacteroidales bacterium]
MAKKTLLGIAIFVLLSSLLVSKNNSNTLVGPNLYRGLAFVEIKARGPNTGGGRVSGDQYRIELTVVFEVGTDKVVDILYTNTGNATTGGHYERLWTSESTNNKLLSNHVTGYPGMITAYIGRTAGELSQTSTSTAHNGKNMVAAITGATQTASNFTSSVKAASQEYLKGNAVRSAWKR